MVLASLRFQRKSCDRRATTQVVRAATLALSLAACAAFQVWAEPLSFAVSADGKRLAIAYFEGYLMLSSDGGRTWTRRTITGSKLWSCSSIVSSSDGKRLLVAGVGVYASQDGGATWEARPTEAKIYKVVGSLDGTGLAACTGDGYVFASRDGGATWERRTTHQDWVSIAASSSGKRLVAAVRDGYLYTSFDGGIRWTRRASPKPWFSVASSSDGKRLVAVDGDYVYTSSDGGTTWARTEHLGLNLVVSSARGSILAGVDALDIYTSTDGGATWEFAKAPKELWTAMVMLPNGKRLYAVSDKGTIFIMDLPGDGAR